MNTTSSRTAARELERAEREGAAVVLRRWLPPGSTVYVVQRYTSWSGMMRHLDLYAIDPDGKDGLVYCTGWAARVLDYKRAAKGGGPLVVRGSGMDLGFATVYELSCALYGTAEGMRHVAGSCMLPDDPCYCHDETADAPLSGVCSSCGCRWERTRGGYTLSHRWI